MKVNTSMIAERAGVSRVTVDKVIHNRPGVSQATRKRVQKIIEETNYLPPKQRKGQTPAVDPVRIAAILPETDDTYMVRLSSGVQAADKDLKKYGLDMTYYSCSTYDAEPMAGILQYLLENPVDAVILRGMNDPLIPELAKKMTAAGIAVFTVDADISDSGRICFIGENLYQTGRISASLLCKSIGYQGKIAALIGSRKIETSSLRLQGFTDYLKEHAPDVEVITIEETLSQHAITYQKTCQLIDKYPDLAAIWIAVSCGEDIARAVKDKAAAGRIHIGTMLLNQDIQDRILEGTIDFSIGLAPFEMGESIVRTAYQYLRYHSKPADQHIETPSYIAIDANVEGLMKNISFV